MKWLDKLKPTPGAVYIKGNVLPESDHETATGRQLYTITAIRKAYDAGYAAGAQTKQVLENLDELSVGDSSFESWYASYVKEGTKGLKQHCRDAYAAGMGDPLVTYAQPAPKQEPFCYLYYERGEEMFAPPDGYRPDDAQALFLAAGAQPTIRDFRTVQERKPLSEAEITRLWIEANKASMGTIEAFTRAIEQAHGIGEQP